MEAATHAFNKSASFSSSAPLIRVNCPFTLEIIMCFTLNSATEWTGSMFQVVLAVCGIAGAFMVSSFLVDLMRYTDNRCNNY